MPIPIFAFEQFSFGEALKAEGGDVHSFGRAVEDQLNQAGANAQFKGTGTINGTGSHDFMLWAGDGATDTFRIKIWDAATETVVYDNGTDQPIGGGSIVVHKK